MHRLPLSTEGSKPTVYVRTHVGIVDAREASDLITRIRAKLSGAKTFVDLSNVDVAAARALARELVSERSITLLD